MVHEDKIFPHRHEVLSAVFLRWIFCDGQNDMPWVAAPIVTHHRDWPEIDRLYPPGDPLQESPDGLDAIAGQMTEEFFLSAERVVRDEILPVFGDTWTVPDTWSQAMSTDWVPNNPVTELRIVLEAVRGLMRRLKQLTLPDPEVIAGTLLRGTVILADHSGSAWEEFRVLEDLKNVERTRDRLGLPPMEQLYEHQKVIACRESNAILTAPTGSGKTEAAFLWAARQSSSTEGNPLVYYLLPYQASLNAMPKRDA